MDILTKDNIKVTVKVLRWAIGVIVASGGTMLGVWEGYSKPQMIRLIEQNNVRQDSIRNLESGSFRGEWAVYLDVPKQKVTYTLYTKLDSLTRFMYEAQKYHDPLDLLSSITPIYAYLDANGEEWQWMPDGRSYRVNYDSDGTRWVVYHGHRRNLSAL